MSHKFFSQRTGVNPNSGGLPLQDILGLFLSIYNELSNAGYFTQGLGYGCIDEGYIRGTIYDIDRDILLKLHKKNLWPINDYLMEYQENDLFDMIEYLYQFVSKPIDGWMHSFGDCGMHWNTFNKVEGQNYYREKINEMLRHYVGKYEMSTTGEILSLPEEGFEAIFEADIPTENEIIKSRIDTATIKYRKHGSTSDDRRQAVRDLTDVLELLRPQVKELLTSSDENDLFNIANNFEIRHLNDRQKSNYDKAIWHSWMFYFYLSTIHVVLRKISAGTTPHQDSSSES